MLTSKFQERIIISLKKTDEGKVDTAALLTDIEAFLSDYAADENWLHLKLGIPLDPPPSNEEKLANIEAFVNAIIAAAE